MSFFKSRVGREITGSEEASFATNFRSLPDNTQAPATIKSFRSNEYQGEINYQIIWKIVDGDFAGAEVKQRITPFDPDDNKAERNLNMMCRIFKLCGHRTDYQHNPTDQDLAEMRGTILDIKIGNGIIQGEERTWVREVWPNGELEICTGQTKVVTGKPAEKKEQASNKEPLESALQRNSSARTQTENLDDIPF